MIDPSVNGTMSLDFVNPVADEDLPYVLDRALRISGYTLLEQSDGSFLVTSLTNAMSLPSSPRLASEGLPIGHGILVAPLRYIGAAEMHALLQPLEGNGAAAEMDDNRGLLILTGTSEQLEAMLDMIALFDVDWIRSVSVALYPLEHASSDAMVGELYSVIGGREGPVGSQLDIIPVNRLNALIVIARQAERLDQVEAWIRRLDVRSATERTVRVHTLMNLDAANAAQHVDDLFGDDANLGPGQVSARADEDTNSLVVYADALGHERVDALLEQLDRMPAQVVIEALIVEVTLTDDLRYGVQWFLDTRDGNNTTWSPNRSGQVAASFPGFSYTYASDYVRAALNAISSLTEVRTISSPHIIVQNNQSASIQVGDEVPVITQSAVSITDPNAPIVNAIQFRDTGVVLSVTARINDSDRIVLDVAQEVSSVSETTTSGIDSPTIQQRRLESTVSLFDGESVVLGGLIRAQQTQTRSGVPGLENAPIVGNLFRETSDIERQTELLVFLTPNIIRSREDQRIVTDRLRDRMERIGRSRAAAPP